jgi:hypothetical protein
MAKLAAPSPSQALIVTAPRPPIGLVPGGPAPANPPASNPRPKKKNKNKKNNTLTWPSFYNPWTGLIQMWPEAPRGPLPGFRPLASSRSSIGGPLRRSSKARLLPSRLSSVGQSGLLSPAQAGCCQVCLVFCPHRLGRRSALVRRFLACLRRHCGCLHRLRHRRVSCKLRPTRSGTTTTSPTTSTQ